MTQDLGIIGIGHGDSILLYAGDNYRTIGHESQRMNLEFSQKFIKQAEFGSSGEFLVILRPKLQIICSYRKPLHFLHRHPLTHDNAKIGAERDAVLFGALMIRRFMIQIIGAIHRGIESGA